MGPFTAGRKAGAVAVIAVLGVIVAALCVMALTRPQQTATAVSPEPLPVLTPTPSATPTPTPAPAPVQMNRADERFLSVVGESAWRATAGSCTGDAPLLQRMNEQGDWVDVVPGENAPRQIASLDAHSDGAELVGGVDELCSPASLRTFSAGAEWQPYEDALARSRYVALIDPAIVHTRAGDIAAPCADATGLRAWGDIVALVCDEQAWQQTDDAWTALEFVSVKALAIADSDLIIGHQTADCTGLALTRASGAENTTVGCAENVDVAQPIAVAATDNGVVVWAADRMIEVAG